MESKSITIAVLKQRICNEKPIQHFCNDSCMNGANQCAISIAIKALEKQIPKKPDIEGDGYDNQGNLIYDTWICPDCNTRYEIGYDNYDYCPNCGQHIGRSDLE